MVDETVLMHGPKFDGSGEIVDREVYQDDVPAYVAAGYCYGANPTQTVDESVEGVITKVVKKKK